MSKQNPFNLTDEQLDRIEQKFKCTFEDDSRNIKYDYLNCTVVEILQEVEKLISVICIERECINKPIITYDWENIPIKYKWVAIDADGAAFAYDVEPYIFKSKWSDMWANDTEQFVRIRISEELASMVSKNKIDFKDTLQKRP